MRKGLLLGLGAALAMGALTVADASACSRRVSDCGGRYYAPPVGYTYAPVPPAPVYGYAPPPAPYYAPPRVYRWNGYGFGPARGYYGAGYANGYNGYGYRGADRGYRNCRRGYGYAPTTVYYDDDDD